MANYEDFDSIVADLIAKGDGTQETKTDDGFQLHLGGKDYKFESREAAERALETHIAQLDAKAREAEVRANTLATANQTPPPAPPAPKEGEVNPQVKEFVTALERGDLKTAANTLFKYGIFDGKIDDPGSVITDSLLRTAQLDRQTSVGTFLGAHPELATNPQAQGVVEQARQFLNLPATPDGFEAAHAYAERKGFLGAAPTQGNRNAPPAVPRGASTTGSGGPQTDAEWEAFANSRTTEELERLINAARR